MMAVTTPDMCRVTVVTPSRWADLALPAGEPLAELLPTLVDHVGDDEIAGRPVGLQRLGSPPLDVDRSLAGNGVLDGETLYLRAVDQLMPTLDFDDAIAGLGAGITGLSNRWRPRDTRRLLVAVAAVPTLLALALLAQPILAAGARPGGPAGTGWACLVAGLAAVVGLGGVAVASRAWADRTLAIVLGAAAIPFAALAAATATILLARSATGWSATGLAASAAVLGTAFLADLAVGRLTAIFAGVAYAGVLAGVGCLLTLTLGWPDGHGIALVLVLAVMSGEVVVPLASRCAGVVLPPLPRTAQELEEGVEPLPAQEVLTRAAHVDEYVTALLAGAALLAVPCAVATAVRGGWATALALVACGSALLRVRVFGGHGQRAAWLVTGLAGPAAVAAATGVGGGAGTRGWLAVGLLVLGAAVLVGAVVLPGRRAVPAAGRAAEILEGLTAAALLPLLLAVLGTYSAARNLW